MDIMRNLGLKILFGKDYKKWSWVPEQLPYTTPAYIADKVSALVYKFYSPSNKEPVIWDMFSGLGGDAIPLAQRGCKIYCTEINTKIFGLLNKNVEAHGLISEIQTFRADSVEKLNVLEADIIYFDPPWGETFNPYREFSFNNVKLDNGHNIIELLRKVHNKTKNIIIKSPLNCHTFESLDFLQIKRTYTFPKHNLKFFLC